MTDAPLSPGTSRVDLTRPDRARKRAREISLGCSAGASLHRVAFRRSASAGRSIRQGLTDFAESERSFTFSEEPNSTSPRSVIHEARASNVPFYHLADVPGKTKAGHRVRLEISSAHEFTLCDTCASAFLVG
jgi:hypothetical protein